MNISELLAIKGQFFLWIFKLYRVISCRNTCFFEVCL